MMRSKISSMNSKIGKMVLHKKNIRSEIAEKYPTLFDYWESEVYVIPPVLTGLDADYIIVNLAVQKLPSENIMDLYVLNKKAVMKPRLFGFLK